MPDGSPSGSTQDITISADIIAAALRNIYQRDFNPTEDIEPTMFNAIAEKLTKAVNTSFPSSNLSLGEDPMLHALRHSADVFAAFKVHRAQNDMAARLLDSNGNLKPFEQWAKEVMPIASHQCGAWLKTEYNTAVLRARQAANWQQFLQEKDVFPNLKWLPSTSPHPGADHKPFWNTILPIDHPFWDQHRPGDRWNCKCDLTSTDAPVTPVPAPDTTVPGGSAAGNTPQPGLTGNPGKTQAIFSDDHPYFPADCRHCPFYKPSPRARLMSAFTARAKDCYNCPYINRCLYGAEKGEIKDIKKKARQRLQGSSLSHPNFDGKITISRRSIDEWTNQPHMHYAEKNRMLLYINEILRQSEYLGYKKDKSIKPGSKWIHLFETEIEGDKSWIVVKEYQDGTLILYSISDSENILIGLNEK